MADGIEEKWPKSLVGMIVFLFILIIAIATLIPNAMVKKAIDVEVGWGRAMLPSSDVTMVMDKTQSWYSALVIESGAKEAVSDMFMPRGGTVDAFERATDWWFTYLANRGETIQRVIFHSIYRLVMLLYWTPFFVIVIIPAVVAGYMRWQAKRHGFDYSSPFLNNNAAKMIVWGTIAMLLSIIAPVPIPPWLVAAMLLAVCPVIISLMISNLPKRI